jgi:inorganic pyrophosphatase/exopolyphosphatase
VAKQNAANAQAAYLAATAAVAKGVACTSTIVSGMCNSTLYMVAAACGLLLMVGLMSGNAPPARR